MSPFSAVLASIDVHTATLIGNLLPEWTEHTIDPGALASFAPAGGAPPVALVVVQSLGDQEELVEWCQAARGNPAFAEARLLVALDPDIALQYGPARAAGAHECLMVPASVGHIERLLMNLLKERFPG